MNIHKLCTTCYLALRHNESETNIAMHEVMGNQGECKEKTDIGQTNKSLLLHFYLPLKNGYFLHYNYSCIEASIFPSMVL